MKVEEHLMFDITQSYWYTQMSHSIIRAILGWDHWNRFPESSVYAEWPDEVEESGDTNP